MIQEVFCGKELTLVLSRPSDMSSKRIMAKALAMLEPFITGMSGEDGVRLVAQLEKDVPDSVTLARAKISVEAASAADFNDDDFV